MNKDQKLISEAYKNVVKKEPVDVKALVDKLKEQGRDPWFIIGYLQSIINDSITGFRTTEESVVSGLKHIEENK